MSSHISNARPKPDKVITDIADYALKHAIKSADAYNTARLCLMDTLGCGLEALSYPACTKLMGPVVPGTIVPNGAKVPGTLVPARPGDRRVQHRLHDPLARFQRHLARRRMGPSVRQPRRHPRHRRLAVAQQRRRRQKAAADARRADRHDQGARNPGRDRAGKQLQPRRPRPRAAGEGRLHRGGHRTCSAARATKSSTRCRTPGSTASRCAPTATRPTPARANRGRRATPPAARCGWR